MEGSLTIIALLFISLTCIQVSNSFPSSGKDYVYYSWKPFVYADLPHSEYSQVDGHDYYISKNVLPTAVSYHDITGCLFIPIERTHPGIPATINYINVADYPKGSSPPLRPFPTYVDNYLPGWFGVNDLKEDDYKYNIYATDVQLKRQDKDEDKKPNEDTDEDKERVQKKSKQIIEDMKNQEKIVEEKQEEDDEDDETRKKHGSHNKPSYSHGHHGGTYVVHLPAPTTTTTTTTAPAPTYKPTKPIYKPPPPPKNPTRDVYHFVSVYYTSANERCSRLFFVDHGTLLNKNKEIFIRPPILWAFDIYECNEENFGYPPALKVTIPDSVVDRPAGFATFNVDLYNDCSEFAVYIANCFDNRIVVYDNAKRSFWYYEHETFYPGAERSLYPGPLPPQDSYNFGVLGVILTEETKYSYKELLYSPGSSYGLFKTTTKTLRNKSLAPGSLTSPNFSFIGYGGQDSQAIMNYDSETQVLFFVHLTSNTLQCWNTNTPLVKGNVVTLFSELEFGVDVSIDNERNLRFFLYYGHGVSFLEPVVPSNPLYNLYIIPIDSIIKGTACDPSNV